MQFVVYTLENEEKCELPVNIMSIGSTV